MEKRLSSLVGTHGNWGLRGSIFLAIFRISKLRNSALGSSESIQNVL